MHKTTLQRSLGKIIIEENMPKPIKVTPVYGNNPLSVDDINYLSLVYMKII